MSRFNVLMEQCVDELEVSLRGTKQPVSQQQKVVTAAAQI